jgi:hypothetical protein
MKVLIHRDDKAWLTDNIDLLRTGVMRTPERFRNRHSNICFVPMQVPNLGNFVEVELDDEIREIFRACEYCTHQQH